MLLVGHTDPTRELRQARTAAIGATREFQQALMAWIATPPRLLEHNRDPAPWSREDVQIILGLQAALNSMVDKRRTYDRMAHRLNRPPR